MTPAPVDILISGGTILSLDPERRIFWDGSIAIRDTRIVEVGRREDVDARWRGAARRIIDGRQKVITPGLIQTHVHVSAEQAVKGVVADTTPPAEWLRQVTPFYAATTAEEEAIVATWTFVELLRTGTTCFIEAGTTRHTPAVIQAMADTGIRGCVGTWSWDIPREPVRLHMTAQAALDANADLIRRFNGAHGDRVRVWASPVGQAACSDELLTGMKELADRYDTGLTMHVRSLPFDIELSRQRTGRRQVTYYHHLGVLGPNVVLAHMAELDAHEIEIVLETGVKIAHCPTTAGWFGFGLTQVSRFPELIDRGATIGLGCDGTTCSNNLDVVRAMYSSAILFRDARRDMRAMPAEKVLEMATLHGARCAQQEQDLGSLEAGKKADVVLFDARRPEWRPLYNPVANLVFAADGHSVDTVLVDGRVVCENGRLTTVDEDSVFRELVKVGARLLRETGWTPPIRWPVIR